MSESTNSSPLERMRKRLYAPPAVPTTAPSSLPERPVSRPSGWQEPVGRGVAPEKPKLAPALVFLLFSFSFFLIAGGIAAVLLVSGGRSVSTDNIKIIAEGPTTIAGGDTLSLLITIHNRNPVKVVKGSLSLVFPDGTYSAEDAGVPLSHYVEDIGDIPAGGTVKKTVRAVVFGNEDQHVAIPMTFEYRTTQSSAVFEKQESYEFTIGTSPVDVGITTLSEIASGQELSVSVSVRSNTAAALENIGVVADMPFGFALNSATPTPIGESLFVFKKIAPGEEAKIVLTGVLTGEESDERVFRFRVGSIDPDNPRRLAVIYTTKETAITVTKPFLAVSLLLNRKADEPTIIQAGTQVQGLLTWVNALSSTILDGELSIHIQGIALDPESVSTSNGFYRSSDTTVVFSGETDAGLRTFQPGDEGNGTFSFSTKTGPGIEALRNPSLILTVSIKGRRVTESGVAEAISSTLTRTIKVASDLTLTSRGVYSVGPFKNTGPWPPKVGEETTYTIVLSASNTVNSVAGARVSLTLPSYVRFTGAVSPSDGTLTYNDVTREVSWNIGDIPAGTSAREAAFQVALLPSLSHEGKSPVLMGAQELTGFDRFIQRNLLYTAPLLTTRIEDDPAFVFSYGNVVQ